MQTPELMRREDRSAPNLLISEIVPLGILAAITIAVGVLLGMFEVDPDAWLLVGSPFLAAWIGILARDRRSIWLAIGMMTVVSFFLLLSIGLVMLFGLIALVAWWFIQARNRGMDLFTDTDLLWDAIGLAGTLAGFSLLI